MGAETTFVIAQLWMSTLVVGVLLYGVFDYVTARRLETHFMQHPSPHFSHDGLGLHTVYYAIALAFYSVRLNAQDYPFIPVNDTRRLATATDKFLAMLFTANFALSMALLVIISLSE
ncbi:hypothetical protein JCM19237_2280 [Photobacterium aphoticum]|uniref:Uncharacterized protein n=1 Tax=Photobacterium aphoticum TaxID=754436 RepID=A0A090QQN4_9GAMM|nr:hypothetical protein JCM19237_2280 [Photobacterium aphoticum]